MSLLMFSRPPLLIPACLLPVRTCGAVRCCALLCPDTLQAKISAPEPLHPWGD